MVVSLFLLLWRGLFMYADSGYKEILSFLDKRIVDPVKVSRNSSTLSEGCWEIEYKGDRIRECFLFAYAFV
ncbi:hypothetical protein HLB03_00880 [Acidianus sp. DSM 29099]|nr:hypothetical protein [Acidianus sp. RZ1]